MSCHIKEIREELGMTQQQLIEKSGLSKTTIHELENGFYDDVKLSTLKKLMAALECDAGQIFD